MNIEAAVTAAIAGLSDLHNNHDHISAKSAIRAAVEARPAYWSTKRYHDQHARNFLDEANNLPLGSALKLRWEVRPDYSAADLLNTLIPLNAAAAKAIAITRSFL